MAETKEVSTQGDMGPKRVKLLKMLPEPKVVTPAVPAGRVDFLTSTRGFGVRYDPVEFFQGCPEILDKIFDEVLSQELCLNPVAIPDLKPYRVSKVWQSFLYGYEGRRPRVALQRTLVNDSLIVLEEGRLRGREPLSILEGKKTLWAEFHSHLGCNLCHLVIKHISTVSRMWSRSISRLHSDIVGAYGNDILLKFVTGVYKIRLWDSFCGRPGACPVMKQRSDITSFASGGSSHVLKYSVTYSISNTNSVFIRNARNT